MYLIISLSLSVMRNFIFLVLFATLIPFSNSFGYNNATKILSPNPIYSLSNPNLPSDWREFKVKYNVNRIIVRNKGRTAAENCKGAIEINRRQEKICWYLESERYTMTINAKSLEYLDVCASLDASV